MTPTSPGPGQDEPRRRTPGRRHGRPADTPARLALVRVRQAGRRHRECQAAHLGYLVSGSLHVRADDGSEVDLSAGNAYRIAPGHDAWVLGDEPVVGLEFESKTAETYARS